VLSRTTGNSPCQATGCAGHLGRAYSGANEPDAVRRRQRGRPATVSTAADQFRLILDALEIPAFARSWPCRRSRCRSPTWRITSMPASATTGFLGVDAGVVDEPDPPVQQVVLLLQPGDRAAGRLWLIACVSWRNLTVTVTGARASRSCWPRWPRLRRARRSSAEHAAEHGTRFDDLRVFRSLPTLPRRFSEAEITPPSSLG
jgi:hypothetical protein